MEGAREAGREARKGSCQKERGGREGDRQGEMGQALKEAGKGVRTYGLIDEERKRVDGWRKERDSMGILTNPNSALNQVMLVWGLNVNHDFLVRSMRQSIVLSVFSRVCT